MDLRTTLTEGFSKLDLKVSDEAVDLFMRYLAELKKWNRVYSITSIDDDHEIVVNHFLDSAMFMAGLDETVRSVADVGSGGGFPGVPLKILRPELEMHLIEPTGKKATFLRTLCGRLGYRDVTVHQKRLEECEGLRVDAAVTRALFSCGEFFDKAGFIVPQGGRIVLSKGPRYEEELSGAGFEHSVHDIRLPFSDATRHIIVIKA